MAKKEEKKLKFLQMPIPSGTQRYSTVTKVDFSGLNKRQVMDTGELSAECNISTKEAPYLTPSPIEASLETANGELKYNKPIAMFGFDDFLIVIYSVKTTSGDNSGYHIMVDLWRMDEKGIKKTNGACEVYTGFVQKNLTKEAYDEALKVQRSMVQFNVYESVTSAVSGKFTRKLLLFPDKVSLNLDIVSIDDMTKADDYTVMYYSDNEYYRLIKGGDGYKSVSGNITINGVKAFECEGLDVELKEYYNDGYIKTNDSEYVVGFFKTEDKYYEEDKEYFIFAREGSLLKVEGLEYNYDVEGEADVIGGSGDVVTGYYEYDADEDKYCRIDTEEQRAKEGHTYYKYFAEDTYEPMLNIIRNADSSTSVRGYYEYTDSEKEYYIRKNDYLPYEYEKVSGLEKGDSVDGYFEFVDYAPDYIDGKANENTDEYKGHFCFNTSNSMVYIFQNGEWVIHVNPNCPDIKYAAVHLSRLIGVGGGRVYVSGYNDYTSWQFDSADDENANHAWCSATQANSKAEGEFTGVTVYDNRVVCFKRDFMHEITGSKNPFRLNDVYAEGAVDNRSICEVNGRLIFAGGNQVKLYTGGIPRVISYNLGFENITKAVAGSDGRNYYLYAVCDGEEHFFVYDSFNGAWSERQVRAKVISMCFIKNGMYILTSGESESSDTLSPGTVYRINGDEYDGQEWCFETDITSAKNINIKHIKKVQILADAESRAEIKVYALYDNEVFDENTSHLLYDSDGRYGRLTVRVKPRMTSGYGFKLHICGKGYVKIYNMSIDVTGGGEKLVQG